MTDEFEKWLIEYREHLGRGEEFIVTSIIEKYRALKQEPLAVLADRKNKNISVCVVICCDELFQEAEFYSEAEARQYLEGLPNTKLGGE